MHATPPLRPGPVRPDPRRGAPRAARALLAAMLLALAGCASTDLAKVAANAQAESNNRQRAEAQAELARSEATPAVTEASSRATYMSLISQMQAKGLYFASLAHLDALDQRWGAAPDSQLLRADALRETGQTGPAWQLYGQLNHGPTQARAAHGLGLLAGKSGDFAGALEHLRQASAAAPTDTAILNDLGYVLLQRGLLLDARITLMKAAELSPDNLRIWGNVALYLLVDGKPEQASALMDSRKLSPAVRNQIADQARALREQAQASAAERAIALPPMRRVPDGAAAQQRAALAR